MLSARSILDFKKLKINSILHVCVLAQNTVQKADFKFKLGHPTTLDGTVGGKMDENLVTRKEEMLAVVYCSGISSLGSDR